MQSLVDNWPSVALVLLALVVIPELCAVAGHWPKAWLALLVGSLAADVFLVHIPAMVLAGLQVYPADVVFGVAALVTATRLLDRRATIPALLAWIAILALVQLGIGISKFGTGVATNEFRAYFYILAGAAFAWACTPRRDAARLLRHLTIGLAGVYAVATLLHWFLYGIGNSASFVDVNGTEVTGRGLTAAGALVIAQAGLLLLLAPTARLRGLQRLTGVAALVMVLLLQHRTVWLATAIVLGAFWLRALLLRRSWSIVVIVGAAWASLTGYLIVQLTGAGQIGARLGESYSSASGTDSTSSWRVEGWLSLLKEPANTLEWLVGRPFGSGYHRVLHNAAVEVQPHNFYVQSLLRIGIVGVLLLVALYVRNLWRALGRSNVAAMVLLSQMIFMAAYALAADQAVLLGLSLLAVASARDQTDAQSTDDDRSHRVLATAGK